MEENHFLATQKLTLTNDVLVAGSLFKSYTYTSITKKENVNIVETISKGQNRTKGLFI